MDDNEKLVFKQLACDIKNLAELNYAILNNRAYNKLMGTTFMKRMERVETQFENLLDALEKRFLMLNNEDLVDLYKNKNKKESIPEMLNRLQK